MKKVLIISYLFNPSKEIGSRRWSKIAKKFLENGIQVDVLTSTISKQEDGINRQYFKPLFPRVLLKQSLTFMDKVLYKISLFFLSLLKGTPYDRSILSGKFIAQKARKLLKEKEYDSVIVSVAPFNMAFEIVKIIKEFPNTKFIVDFRDPWTWDSNYGMDIISNKKRKLEEYKERKVSDEFGLIIVPSEFMNVYFSQKYNKEALVLPHFYDFQSKGNKRPNHVPEGISLIYGGTVYEESISDVIDFNTKMVNEGGKCEVNYSIFSANLSIKPLTKNNNFSFEMRGRVEENKLFKEIRNSDYYLAFYPERYKNFISSKIYEIVALRTPIILVSENGELSNFIENNNLGLFYNISDIDELVEGLKSNSLNLKYNSSYPIEQFSLSNVVQDLITNHL